MRHNRMSPVFVVMVLIVMMTAGGCPGREVSPPEPLVDPDSSDPEADVQLPAPDVKGGLTVEAALQARRSQRSFSDDPLSLQEVSQLLWAAQGVTDSQRGFRTAPSAGATYPLEVYVTLGKAEGLAGGLYRYDPGSHQLCRESTEDLRDELYEAALRQTAVRDAPVVMVLTAIYGRTTARYGERGVRYVHMEAGHTAQNIYLQAASLGLGAVVIGAFDDSEVQGIMDLREDEHPLYLIPLGKPER